MSCVEGSLDGERMKADEEERRICGIYVWRFGNFAREVVLTSFFQARQARCCFFKESSGESPVCCSFLSLVFHFPELSLDSSLESTSDWYALEQCLFQFSLLALLFPAAHTQPSVSMSRMFVNRPGRCQNYNWYHCCLELPVLCSFITLSNPSRVSTIHFKSPRRPCPRSRFQNVLLAGHLLHLRGLPMDEHAPGYVHFGHP